MVPEDQQGELEEGDDIAVYDINNTVDEIKGRLTIWFNKEMACIDINNCSIWGYWDEIEELVLTEEYAEAKDPGGIIAKGKLAYNTHGIGGIYSDGNFYTIIKDK